MKIQKIRFKNKLTDYPIIIGRNSIITSLRKKSSISHEVIKKIHIYFPNYSVGWIIFGNENES